MERATNTYKSVPKTYIHTLTAENSIDVSFIPARLSFGGKRNSSYNAIGSLKTQWKCKYCYYNYSNAYTF